MLIHVEHGKGGRDRHAMLSPHLLDVLRAYWRRARPALWLFPGREPGTPVSIGALQAACRAARRRARIGKPVTVHTLRHSFATHLRHAEPLRPSLAHGGPARVDRGVRPVLEVADIFRRHGEDFRAAQGERLTGAQRRVMAAIESCRTAVLGGHVEQCEHCRELRVAYNSCRNRHCPKCQGLARLQWLADRRAEFLPVPYFHLVFTLPAPVAAIALTNKAVVYDILFKAAADTVRTIGADPKHLGGETGMIALLHTWGQTLTHHPHVHCIVPGGGLGPDGGFVRCRRRGFFLPVRVLSRLYRRLFLDRLQAAFEAGSLTFFGEIPSLRDPSAFGAHIRALRSVPWVVYAKRPFAGPGQVLDYLGRYTHRVAITNGRLLACEDGRVRFRWKDYRCGHKSKAMTLAADEFIRRFLLHVLPTGFRRIRHFGFLANACRSARLARLRAALDVPAPAPPVKPADYRERFALLTGRRIDQCPWCGGRMVDLGRPLPRCRRPSDPFPRCDTS